MLDLRTESWKPHIKMSCSYHARDCQKNVKTLQIRARQFPIVVNKSVTIRQQYPIASNNGAQCHSYIGRHQSSTTRRNRHTGQDLRCFIVMQLFWSLMSSYLPYCTFFLPLHLNKYRTSRFQDSASARRAEKNQERAQMWEVITQKVNENFGDKLEYLSVDKVKKLLTYYKKKDDGSYDNM